MLKFNFYLFNLFLTIIFLAKCSEIESDLDRKKVLVSLKKQNVSDINFAVNLRGYPITVADNGLIWGLPYLGFYNSENSLIFNKRLAYINFKYYMIRDIIPQSIESYLKNYYNVTSKNWPLCLANQSTLIKFSTSIFSTTEKAPNNIYSIFYNTWVADLGYIKQFPNSMSSFATSINTGIFNNNGICKVPLDLSHTKNLQNICQNINNNIIQKEHIALNYQNLSPSNLKIIVDKKREIASFWSMAQTEPNNPPNTSMLSKNVSINYFLLINNKKIEDWLTKILNNSTNINELYNNLTDSLEKANWIESTDKKSLRDWIDTVKKALEPVSPEELEINCD